MTETIEQAAENNEDGTIIQFLCGTHSYQGVWFGKKHPNKEGVFWWRIILRNQYSQPNPHPITTWHLRKLEWMLREEQINYSRMVEILNEIASGKHKERIEI
jgi:hypothetical protein